VDRRQIDFLTQLQDANSFEACWSVLQSELKKLGFKHSMYGFCTGTTSPDTFHAISISNYPESFMESYEKLGGALYDETVQWCLTQDQPLCWSNDEALSDLSSESALIEELSASYGIRCGYSIPFPSITLGTKAGIGVSATQVSVNEFDRDIAPSFDYVKLICAFFETYAARFPLYHAATKQKYYPLEKLSQKEIEILRWLANGLRVQTIADQKIYRSTESINKYIASAKTKLKARTQAQLIAKAYILGIV